VCATGLAPLMVRNDVDLLLPRPCDLSARYVERPRITLLVIKSLLSTHLIDNTES
jgi:hypothetical protein